VPRLEIIQNDDHLEWIVLSQKTSAIGRDPSCQVVIEDEQASRRHAEIVEQDDGWWVKDLKSTNGTIVNDKIIVETRINDGDCIRVGNHRMIFHAESPEAEKEEAKQELKDEKDQPDDITLDSTLSVNEEMESVTISVKADKESDSQKDGYAGRINEILSSVFIEKDLFQSLLDLAIKSTGADRACLILRESDGAIRVAGVRTVMDLPKDAPTCETLIQHAMDTKEALLFTSGMADDLSPGAESAKAESKRSVMAAPLIHNDEVLGSVQVDADRKVEFDEKTLRQLMSLASDIAGAISQNRLIRRHAHSERLEGIDMVLRGMMRCMTDITKSMKSGSRQVEIGLKNDTIGTVNSGWTKVRDARRRLASLIRDVTEVVDDKPPLLMGTDLNTLVGNALDVVRNRATESGTDLVFNEDTSLEEIEIDPMGIYRAVKNILTNAIEATAEVKDAKVTISTMTSPDGKNAQVVIEDNGQGIGRDRLADIFVLFNSSKRDACLGLGLPVAQKTVKEHGGEIALDSTIGGGTTFRISLPIRKSESS
jgi:two-component system, NtrC family, sensor kinase